MDCSTPGFSCRRDFSGENTGVGCPFFLQWIFLTQGSYLVFNWRVTILLFYSVLKIRLSSFFLWIVLFWLCWISVAEWLSPSCRERELLYLRCSGFSLQWLLLLQSRALGRGAEASVAVAHGLNGWGSGALEHRVSSWGAQASLLCGMWELPGPGIEPVSPALAGRFFSNEPPGKTKNRNFILITENFYISKGPLHNGLY